MNQRKLFIAVHQKDVEEFKSLDDALEGMDETRRDYHQGGYRVYDFEGGVYQRVEEGSSPQIGLPNQREYDQRKNKAELRSFAVVDKADNSALIGTRVNISGVGTIVLTEENLPQLTYHGFDTFDEARVEFERRKENDAGLYALVVFQRVPGPGIRE